MTGRHDGESGQALLEFALVLPVLVLFLLGIVDVGRIAEAHLIVGEAARDGARYASLGDTDADIQQVIQTDASYLGSGVTWGVNPTGSRTSGSSVTVTVGDGVQIIDPLFAAILGNSFPVQSNVTMRVE